MDVQCCGRLLTGFRSDPGQTCKVEGTEEAQGGQNYVESASIHICDHEYAHQVSNHLRNREENPEVIGKVLGCQPNLN